MDKASDFERSHILRKAKQREKTASKYEARFGPDWYSIVKEVSARRNAQGPRDGETEKDHYARCFNEVLEERRKANESP